MRSINWITQTGLVLWLGISCPVATAWSAESEEFPAFQEVYDLIRTNASALNEKELNRAAVLGLLDQLKGQAGLTGRKSVRVYPANSVVRTNVFDGACGYLRLAGLQKSSPEDFRLALQTIQRTNDLKGLILDLRFTGGDDYQAAAMVANRFFATEQDLLRWGDSTFRSEAKSNAWVAPVAVLINQDTAEAAEALAGMLKQTHTAVIIGSTTAKRAHRFKEFSLAGGQRLQVAVSPVVLGNGERISQGIVPDILVSVPLEDEKQYFTDAFKLLAATKIDLGLMAPEDEEKPARSATNRVNRARINEAELVRMQKEGVRLDEETASLGARDAEQGKPQIQDPVLARAVDLLKGLAVVQKMRKS